MPELPEVETVVRELDASIVNKRIVDVITLRDKIRYDIPDLSTIIGSKIVKVERRAKYIVIHYHSQTANHQPLILHLGMSGKISVGAPQERIKHDHVVFAFDDESELVFNDARRFGFIIFDSGKELAHLGVEPLAGEFDGKFLSNKLNGKKQPIKTAIMDQAVVVGVGNIYASEALFRSGILPTRQAGSLNSSEYKKLAQNIKTVLAEAIESGGSTLRDYVRSSGDLGYFQHFHAVYGKDGEPCHVCGTNIESIRQAGRSSFFCPKCQS